MKDEVSRSSGMNEAGSGLAREERVKQTAHIFEAFRNTLTRTPEVCRALEYGFFGIDEAARKELQAGKIAFRRRDFVWELEYKYALKGSELRLTKYPPVGKNSIDMLEEVRLEVAFGRAGGVADASTRYSRLFSDKKTAPVVEMNTQKAVQEAYRFLDNLRG